MYIYIFIRLRNILRLENLKRVYYAIVQSMLQYGIIGWGGTYDNILKPLKIIQRLIIKVILKKPSTFSTETLFATFNVPTIDIMYKKYSIIQIFKEKQTNNFQTSMSARYQNNIRIPKLNTKHSQNTYTYLGIKYYNNLPLDLKLIENIKEFQLKLKDHLKQLKQPSTVKGIYQ